MTKRTPAGVVVIDVVTDHTCELRGRRARTLLMRASAPALYNYRPPSGREACWTTSAKSLPDVLAAAQAFRFPVVLHDRQEELW